MSAGVVFVGLDSADPILLDRFEQEGLLPTISDLHRDGRTFDLDNPMGTLAAGIWPEIGSGRSAARSGLYFPYYQFCSGEVEPRPREMREFDPRSFWTEASGAGRRVAVVDFPVAVRSPGLNGIEIVQWGSHERPYADCLELTGQPDWLVDEIVRRYGPHRSGKRHEGAH